MRSQVFVLERKDQALWHSGIQHGDVVDFWE